MQYRNNLLLIFFLTLFAFLCAIPLQWVTLMNPDNSLGISLGLVSLTGASGRITLLMTLPIWLLLLISASAVGISASNFAGFTTIPKFVPIVLLLFSGAFYATLLFTSDPRVTISVGPILAIIATLTSLALTSRRNSTVA